MVFDRTNSAPIDTMRASAYLTAVLMAAVITMNAADVLCVVAKDPDLYSGTNRARGTQETEAMAFPEYRGY